MQSFLRILGYLKKYAFSVTCNISFNILSVIFSLVSLVMILPFLQLLFDRQPLVLEKPVFALSKDWLAGTFNYVLSTIIVDYGKSNALLFVCALVLTVFFLKNLFRYMASHVLATIRNGTVRDIRNQVFTKIVNLPLAYFSETKKGDIITRVTVDVQEVEQSIISVLEATFREPVNILSYLIAMLIISPELTLFVFIVLPLTGIIIARIGRSLRKSSHKAQGKLGLLMSTLDESLSGLRIIKGFNAEEQQLNRFQRENEQHYRLMKKMARRRSLSSPLTETLSIGVVCLVLYAGGQMVLNQSLGLEAEAFILFIVIFSQIIPPAKAFSTAFYNIQKGLASFERISEVLDTKQAIEEAANPKPLTNFKESIEFKNINFAYDQQTVLSNVSLLLRKGESLALVGPSGAGKSTLADLVPRFYEVTDGAILLDGVNIKNYGLAALRNLIGIVTQEPILFNDTVFNNITFGIEGEITKEKVIQAAQVANAHDFILELDNGYDTLIGDRGGKLSGGQRQRLTIARAVLKNPPILILDEATSSLDSASEKLVQQALFELMKNRTSIIIAHRLSTIQFADKIVVLQNGRIVEQGNHEQLLAKEGTYKNLVDLQAF